MTHWKTKQNEGALAHLQVIAQAKRSLRLPLMLLVATTAITASILTSVIPTFFDLLRSGTP